MKERAIRGLFVLLLILALPSAAAEEESHILIAYFTRIEEWINGLDLEP